MPVWANISIINVLEINRPKMSKGKIPLDPKIWLDNLPIIALGFKKFYWHLKSES